MQIKIKISDTNATCWVDDDETDTFTMSGPPRTLDALARALRAQNVEHEFTQRGANREPVANDLTKSERDAVAEAQAKADADAARVAEAAKLEASRAALTAERDRLNKLLAE